MGIIYKSVLAGISKSLDIDHDPLVTSTDVPGGSILIQYDDTGALPVFKNAYIKLSDGNNIDVAKIAPFLKQTTLTAVQLTVTDEDIILSDPGAAGADITINLPPSGNRFNAISNIARPITIRNIHNLNNFRVNIFSDSPEEVNEVFQIQLKRGESVTLTPDGSDWWSIST